ncbi:hypothetical protein [Fibrobacter intestinalis]|uniref:hypothetical protein n=1 Tax=Fibrobacter sp. NR9 TaxID=1896200 RepID=UPI000BB0F610|nr:hypothetical protein [Fibrobacter sp. NR9]
MNWEFGETVASSFFVRDGIRQNAEDRFLPGTAFGKTPKTVFCPGQHSAKRRRPFFARDSIRQNAEDRFLPGTANGKMPKRALGTFQSA